ncbi:hypothetical protein O1D41_003546 [Vibrio cholerae]|uniref:hypothetical protein n=1 Tax=Vibrio metoecus TaxID=1481663 RepID=UPI000BA942CD|nr:hypothetical protein [Vibrio metoecus]EKF9814180.1 hypothetical protein [Vibrio cholerae]ELT6289803.1 hypothetical protein [Vibrio cholerae]PAR33918.1 hypothetical protein CGT97_18660 [Vibrio metoecus]PAR40597.1 hypothetical protein CGT96_17730 [Vibrio metoecus]
MKSKILTLITLVVACSVNAQNIITTSFGDFQIEAADLHYQTYKFNGKSLGYSEFLEVDGQLLGMSNGSDYIVLRGVSGGSGCAEVLSIVKLSEGQAYFSPALDACGGVDNVEFNNGVVTVTAFERDETTKVEYLVKDSKVLENGKNMLVKHNFFESY